MSFLLSHRLPVSIYIATRYLTANLKQSLLISLAVGIGVAIIVFIPSVNLSFYNNILAKTLRSSPHIRVLRELKTLTRNQSLLSQQLGPGQELLISDQTRIRRKDLPAYRSLMKEIKAIPGVIAVAPYIEEQVILVNGNRSLSGQVHGILPALEKQVTDIENDVKTGNLDTLSGEKAFLGWRLAEELGVSVGDRVQMVTGQNKRNFKVAGLTNSGLYFQDMQDVFVNLQNAQTLFQMQGSVTALALKISVIDDADILAKQIAREFDLKTRHWMEENEEILKQVTNFRVIIAFINFLIIFAAASSITSMLIMTVASKSREIGILKAVGMTRNAIIQIFVFQAILLSILGAAAGVLGAQALIELYNASPIGKAAVWGIEREPVTLSLEYTIIGLFYSMITSFLASLIPAWQAGRLDPVKAIHQ